MFSIREICYSDYDKGIIELLSQLTTISIDKIPKNKFYSYIQTLMCNNNHYIFVIEDACQIIASGTLLIEFKLIHNLGKVGHIEDIVIDKNYRKKGLGALMINHLIDLANEKECYKVILDCDIKNQLFYNKCGFLQKGIEMSYYFEK